MAVSVCFSIATSVCSPLGAFLLCYVMLQLYVGPDWRDRDVVGHAAAMLVRPSVVHSVVGSGTSGLPAGLRVAAAARRRRSGLPALCCNCAVLVLLQMHAQPVPYDRSGRLQYHNRLRHGAFGRARVRCRAGSAHDARSNIQLLPIATITTAGWPRST